MKERYGKDIAIELADSELKLDPTSRQLTSCPTIFWQQRKANFVIFKFGDHQFKCIFYYRNYDQFGTGQDEYDDITECVTTLLQVQSDHERQQAGIMPKSNKSISSI